MRRLHILFILLSLCVPLLLGFKLLPRDLPASECSPEFRRFADSPHLAAAYLRDFQIDDTLALATTTLVARDSTGWDTLRRLCPGEYPIDVIKSKLAEGKDAIAYWRFRKGHLGQPADSEPDSNDCAYISFSDSAVVVFHTATATQRRAVMKYSLMRSL